MAEKLIAVNGSVPMVDGSGIMVETTLTANLQASKTAVPSTDQEIIVPDEGYDGLEQVVVSAMPTSTHPKPTISVSNAGVITASHTQSTGYVTGGTTTETSNLSTQAAATITPSAVNQTAVASGKYTTGDVVVSGDANLTAENIAKDVSIFGVTGTHEGGSTAQPTTFTVTASGSSNTRLKCVYLNSNQELAIYDSSFTQSFSVNTLQDHLIAVTVYNSMSTSSLPGSIVTTNCTYVGPKSATIANTSAYSIIGIKATGSVSSLSFYLSCFLPETLITLSDGTEKAIKDLTYDDELLVWNFDTGNLDTANICWLTKSGFHNDHYYQLTFSDGTVLKPTGQNSNHKLYDVNDRYFKGVNIIEVGDEIYSKNGIVTVTDKQYIEEDVEYYNLITNKTINCFANGILASDRYGNLYPIDENMKYIKDERPVRPYSEFEAAGISEYWYEPLRLSEGTQTIDEVVDYIKKLESQMLDIERTY